jgi:hypothetical protein
MFGLGKERERERNGDKREYEALHNLCSSPNGRAWRETRNAYKKHFRGAVVIGKIIL